MHLAGLGVDEVRRERAGVAAEERVRQRAVAPEEADEVQPHHEHRERVDEARDGVGAQRGGEQRAVGQRELQVARDDRGRQVLAGRVGAAGDDADRVDARDVAAAELEEQVVLALGDRLDGLLDGVDDSGHAHEAHDVARDAAGQRDDRVLGPLLERDVPREEQQIVLTGGGRDSQAHRTILASAG